MKKFILIFIWLVLASIILVVLLLNQTRNSLSEDIIKPLANDCTEVLVWHTKTVSEKTPKVKLAAAGNSNNQQNPNSNLKSLVDDLIFKGMNVIDVNSKNELKQCLNAERCGKYSNI